MKEPSLFCANHEYPSVRKGQHRGQKAIQFAYKESKIRMKYHIAITHKIFILLSLWYHKERSGHLNRHFKRFCREM